MSNKFSISFKNNTNKKIVLKNFDTAGDANSFKTKIEPYFRDKFNENSEDYIVERDLLDASKVVTFNVADSRYVKFTVHMRKSKNNPR